MNAFRPGLSLARDFYRDVVQGLVDQPHTACLLEEGSDVLGYDQPRSTDHEWGPQLQVFVAKRDVTSVASAIEHGLPERFGGWLWMMASQWHLIGNTEPLVGRTAEAADRRGSRLTAARLVRLVMELYFLQERRYWPYPKWFGTAFSRLSAAATVGPMLDALRAAGDHPAREEAMVAVLEAMAQRHNEMGVTAAVDPACRPFEVGINGAVRPYRVLNTGRFVVACREAIVEDSLRELVTVGSIDQLTHADDAMVNFTPWPQRLRDTYRQLLGR
jgi:hypothetical protein